MNWDAEWKKIQVASARYGLDHKFIASIRKVENGDPGREFGILSVSAPDYDSQLRVCCQTVRHRLVEFDQRNAVLTSYSAPNGDVVLMYSDAFIHYLASIYAPSGADNDPQGLNLNWARNLKWHYGHFTDADHQVAR